MVGGGVGACGVAEECDEVDIAFEVDALDIGGVEGGGACE